MVSRASAKRGKPERGPRKASDRGGERPALALHLQGKTRGERRGWEQVDPARGEWLGPARRRPRPLSLGLGGGGRGAGPLHPTEGSCLAPKPWARRPKARPASPSRPIPLAVPLPVAGARGLPPPSLPPLGAKSGGGKEPGTKAHARPLGPRQGGAGARACSLRRGPGPRGRVLCRPGFPLFYKRK